MREVLRMLKRDGWVQVSHSGSHRQFKHPVKAGRVTVAGPPNKELGAKTVRSILLQAGLRRR